MRGQQWDKEEIQHPHHWASICPTSTEAEASAAPALPSTAPSRDPVRASQPVKAHQKHGISLLTLLAAFSTYNLPPHPTGDLVESGDGTRHPGPTAARPYLLLSMPRLGPNMPDMPASLILTQSGSGEHSTPKGDASRGCAPPLPCHLRCSSPAAVQRAAWLRLSSSELTSRMRSPGTRPVGASGRTVALHLGHKHPRAGSLHISVRQPNCDFLMKTYSWALGSSWWHLPPSFQEGKRSSSIVHRKEAGVKRDKTAVTPNHFLLLSGLYKASEPGARSEADTDSAASGSSS